MSASPPVPYQAYKVRLHVPPRHLLTVMFANSRRDILARSLTAS